MVRVPIAQKSCSEEEKSECMDSMKMTDFETGEIVCQKCGEVLQDDATWSRRNDNTFTKNTYHFQINSRSPLRYHDMGLSTVIDKYNQDSKGNPINYKMRQEMNRLRLWDSRSQAKNTFQRNLRASLSEMEKLKEKLCLSDAIIERSAYIYRKAAKAQLIRGRRINGIVGACVYIACREMGVTRTIIDISKNIQESRSSIAKNYRMLFQNLKLTISVPDPLKCIIKISNNLEIPENTKREAVHIYDILREKELTSGKKPDTVAATVIYMACIKTGINLSQQKISKISGITGVTIRNRYKDYLKYVKLI